MDLYEFCDLQRYFFKHFKQIVNTTPDFRNNNMELYGQMYNNALNDVLVLNVYDVGTNNFIVSYCNIP
jgi:hypothetical protein